MTILLHAFGLLAALGTAIFAVVSAAGARGRWRRLLTLWTCSATLSLWTASMIRFDVVWMGLLLAGFAIVGLTSARPAVAMAIAAGCSAGFWSWSLKTEGLPAALSVALAGSVLLLAGVSARRPDFASPGVREESLLFVAGLGLAVAVGPQLVAGFRTAAALNSAPERVGSLESTLAPSTVSWALVFAVLSVLLGGAFTLLRRR